MKKCYKCAYRCRVTLSCDHYMLTGIRVVKNDLDCSGFKEREDAVIDPNMLEMERLYYEGLSDRGISRYLGVTRYSVYSWRISMGLEPNGNELRGRPKKG